MNPEELLGEIRDTQQKLHQLEILVQKHFFSSSYQFDKDSKYLDGRNMVLGTSGGTKIGTATSQKLAFWGVTPVAQQGSIGSPGGGTTVDSQSRTAIAAIITALHNIGLIA